MLDVVRRFRWMIGLLLLLAGQVGVVHAAAAPTCPRSDDVASEWASNGADRTASDIAPGGERLSSEGDDRPDDGAPTPFPSGAGCGGAAWPISNTSAGSPPGGAPHFLPMDAVPPRPATSAFFRPPQSS
jgi:hypothetical protein